MVLASLFWRGRKDTLASVFLLGIRYLPHAGICTNLQHVVIILVLFMVPSGEKNDVLASAFFIERRSGPPTPPLPGINASAVLKPVDTVDDFGDNLSKTATVAEKCDCRRIRRQSHFSATL